MMMTMVLTSADERGESSLVAEEGVAKALLVISETILSIAYSVRKASPCKVSLQRLMSLLCISLCWSTFLLRANGRMD